MRPAIMDWQIDVEDGRLQMVVLSPPRGWRMYGRAMEAIHLPSRFHESGICGIMDADADLLACSLIAYALRRPTSHYSPFPTEGSQGHLSPSEKGLVHTMDTQREGTVEYPVLWRQPQHLARAHPR